MLIEVHALNETCPKYVLCISWGAFYWNVFSAVLGKGVQFCCYTICALYDVCIVYIS